MQNSFSFSRLGLLIKKQWYDNAKLYTLSFFALTGILAIVFICWVAFHETIQFEEEDTFLIFAIFLFAVGIIFASTTFASLGDKARGTHWLTVPATHLEKLVCGLFYSMIVFLVVYVAVFLVIRQVTFFWIKLDPVNQIEYQHNIGKGIKNIFLIFLSVQSLFILGSVYFEKFSFIKTILFGLVLIFVYILIFQFVFRQLFGAHSFHMRGLSSFTIYEQEDMKIYRLAPVVDTVLENLFQYIWAPVLLAAAYFRLKEKEL